MSTSCDPLWDQSARKQTNTTWPPTARTQCDVINDETRDEFDNLEIYMGKRYINI